MNPFDLLALVCGLTMIPFLPAMWREIRGEDRGVARKEVPPHRVPSMPTAHLVVLVPVHLGIVGMIVMLVAGKVG